jgi:diaminohydroxyphosphoribosylaminopyrimidine deaminase/5-amino-6-(5-phosphoribosylamino)uracil reductase
MIVVVGPKAPAAKIKKIKALGAEVLTVKTKNGTFMMDRLMKELGKRRITSVLVEGGGTTNAAALSTGIADKLYFFIAPKIIGGEKAPTPVEGAGEEMLSKAIKLKDVEYEKIGDDILVKGYVIK